MGKWKILLKVQNVAHNKPLLREHRNDENVFEMEECYNSHDNELSAIRVYACVHKCPPKYPSQSLCAKKSAIKTKISCTIHACTHNGETFPLPIVSPKHQNALRIQDYEKRDFLKSFSCRLKALFGLV